MNASEGGGKGRRRESRKGEGRGGRMAKSRVGAPRVMAAVALGMSGGEWKERKDGKAVGVVAIECRSAAA